MTSPIALVTGANRGIGYETCRQLADQGFQVILTSRDPAKGEAAAKTLRGAGKTVDFLPLDVTDAASAAQLAQVVRSQYGRLDVLVNNAAVYLDEGVSVFDIDESTLHTTIETNLYGPFHLCRAFAPMMRAQRYGRIVNVSSTSGQLNSMGGRTASYAMSKAALNALTCIVAAELRGAGDIKVNSVCPGWVRTDMGGPGAPRSVQQGADTIIWLATLPADGPSGGFFRDRKPIPW